MSKPGMEEPTYSLVVGAYSEELCELGPRDGLVRGGDAVLEVVDDHIARRAQGFLEHSLGGAWDWLVLFIYDFSAVSDYCRPVGGGRTVEV